eukprot:jgi/Botrbrau1/18021/Bobra.0062s0013.1
MNEQEARLTMERGMHWEQACSCATVGIIARVIFEGVAAQGRPFFCRTPSSASVSCHLQSSGQGSTKIIPHLQEINRGKGAPMLQSFWRNACVIWYRQLAPGYLGEIGTTGDLRAGRFQRF